MTTAVLRKGSNSVPRYTGWEYKADATVHAAGVTAALVGGVWLLASRAPSGPMADALGLAAYAVAMAAMLASSAAYNLNRHRRHREWLRRLDHAGIFLAIAGTYTPLLLRLPAAHAIARPTVALAVVWMIAAAGITLKLSAPRRYERLGLALYLCLGWIGLPLIPILSGRLQPDTGALIGLGALIYTVGVGAYLLERLRYHNVVWHLMVLVAAGCHYLAMLVEFRPGPS
ncbi:PAQR family membrane homeostasis protein TrhA [Nitrospirillum viridazoti]|uniref:DNA-binding protein n=1 Tax=Nitrospirillum viridazoti CBAmc TaxID=1441467 RepID=A0A248JNV9_9PROT|nr:hemolysin III family protein [Nitrospirillum amazonense]ASG20299.1 DNA-binding protein [Nitrospirillum amazonense CBAmc]TWB34672.1 hemolysin III [Nitrospirillum amazonense]